MKILFDCVSWYDMAPKFTWFVKKIYHQIADALPQHQCMFSNCEDRMIFKSDIVPDVIFTWNQNDETEKRLQYFRQNGCKLVIYSEKGWIPCDVDHFYFDLSGVNYSSTLNDWNLKGLLYKTEHERLIEYLVDYQMQAPKNGLSEKDYILLPLQVQYDMQITQHSPFETMQGLIDFVGEVVTDKTVYVKPHPSDLLLKPETLKYPDNFHLINANMQSLIRNCRYMITINSTSGIEALTYYKPVITLGNAFYGKPILVHSARDAVELRRAVEVVERHAGSGVPNKHEIQAFLYWLIFKRQWCMDDLTEDNVLSLVDGCVEKS